MTINLVKLIFDPLAIVQGDNVVPLLAKEIQTTDNKVFTLPLRSGVQWHDGKPFTADDVVFSVEFYRKNMQGDSAIDVRPIKSVTAAGDTVTMTLTAPDPEFPRRILADMAMLPKHIWQSVTKVGTAGVDKAIGTGPYKLTKYDKSRGYTLTANPSYAMGKPRVETLKVVVIPEESTQFAALRTGEIQMSTRIVPPQQLSALEKQPNMGIVKGAEFASTLLAFNNSRPPFDKPEVRRALAKAINVDDLVKTSLLGQGKAGSPGVHPPGVLDQARREVLGVRCRRRQAGPRRPRRQSRSGRRTDPQRQADVVRAAGAEHSTDRLRSAELIRDMFKAVGVAVKITSLDADVVTAKVWPDYDMRKGRNYDMSMWGWSAPVQFASGTVAQLFDSDLDDGSLNIVGFKDPATDTILDELRSAPTMEGRTAAAKKLQARVVEQMPFLTLYYRNGSYDFRKDVYDGWTWQNGSAVLNKFSFVDYELA